MSGVPDPAELLDSAEAAVAEARRRDESPPRPPDERHELGPRELRRAERARRYVLTCAQNNTPVNAPFFAALRAYAEHHGARLLVVPMRYKNPTSRRDPQEDDVDRPDYWWPEELHPHLAENRVRLHARLLLLGDLRVAATAANPLAGLDVLSGAGSLIVGHPQLRMECVATPHGRLPRVLHTTGSVSERNYSTTASGYKAGFHHVAGALVVRCDGDLFHLRQLVWDSGSQCFHDLTERWGPGGLEADDERAAALVTGDEHALWMEPAVRTATYGAGGIAEVLRPPVIVRHDVLDGYAVSAWHDGDLVERAVKHREGRHRVEDELRHLAEHLEATTPEGARNVVVASNHNDRLMRWLRRADPQRRPWDAQLYHELMSVLLAEARMERGGAVAPDPLALWARLRERPRVPTEFLRRSSSFEVAGVELAYHGDVGTAGGRGSMRTLAKVADKCVVGHYHSPGIRHGCWAVGTSGPLAPAYSRGPSASMHTHCVVHTTGKRQLITVLIDGRRARWR